MKYIASCSFGKDSIASIILAHIHGDPIDMVLYSHVRFEKDISGEHPEHINFIYNVAIPRLKEWGLDVEIVEAKKTYIDSFYHVLKRSKKPERIGKYRGFPICGLCAVNRDIKIKPIKDFYKTQNMDDIVQYVGIAIDETKRLNRMHEKGNQVSLLEKYKYTEAMAYGLCKKYGLLSPVYEFSKRGGCWFCPNSKDSEFSHVKQHHKYLWDKLLYLGKEENMVTKLFNRKYTINDIDDRI